MTDAARAAPTGFTPLDHGIRRGLAVRAARGPSPRTPPRPGWPVAVYDVTSVAHELAANAVVHGAGHGRVRLWADGGFLYCQVSDDGRDGLANQPVASGDGAAAWPAEHGHGLWLARQVADHVGIGDGPSGTTATARFPLAPR